MKKSVAVPELGPFQLVILALTLLVLGALAVQLLFEVPEETARVLRWIDHIVCIFFFIEFSVRFHRAESKRQFMKWGWVDLLASIPAIDVLRWGRLLRVVRILRLLRAVRSLRLFFELFFRNRTSGGMASAFLITFLMLSIASVGILLCEHEEDSNIKTAEDAVWWSITTITTVGYGDRYPVTLPGRILASALMITGVGLFGTLSGVVASLFLGNKASSSPPAEDAVLARLEALQQEVAALRSATSASPPGGEPPAPHSSLEPG